MVKKKDRQCLSPEEIQEETTRLARDLAFQARAPVTIQLVGGDHIAFTYNTDDSKKQHHIPIVMNPAILAGVRNKEQALKIWHGIGYHELAHHLHPADAQYKQAHKEGFRHLFNLVDDEQNERRCRAENPEWGRCFQSVCAHIFPYKKRDSDTTLSPGIIDGEKEGPKPRGVAANKVYTRRWNLFAFHFRRHVPDCPDPVVGEALSLIPKRFMDLEKEELLELTRQIHLTLARGIELDERNPNEYEPEPADEKPEEEEEKEENKPDEKPGSDEDGEPQPEEEAPVARGWSLSRLLHSKWTWAFFGLCLIGWMTLMLQADIEFWVEVTITLCFILTALTAFLFMRRAMIKAMLKRAGASIGARAGPIPGKVSNLYAKRSTKIVLAILVLALCAYGLYLLTKIMPFEIVALGTQVVFLVFAFWAMRKIEQRRKESNKKPSKLTSVGLVAMCLFSLVGLIFTLYFMGINNMWLALIGAPLGLITLIVIALYLSPKNGESGSDESHLTFGEKLWLRLRGIGEALKDLTFGFFAAIFKFIATVVTAVFTWIWGWIVRFWRALVAFYWYVFRMVRRGYWRIEPTLVRLWRHTLFRLAVISLPVAMILVMIYAILFTAAKFSIWLLIALIILLLLLLALLWLFRKKIMKFVVNELFMPMPALMDSFMKVPLDMQTEWFVQVDNVRQIDADHDFIENNMDAIQPLAQQLRPLLQKCGRQVVEIEGVADGYELIEEIEQLLVGDTNVFVNDDTTPKPSLHIEVALDCSSSMQSPTESLKPGEKFLLGKFFSLVVEQAVINLPGVSARFWGFTHNAIYDCGKPGEGRMSGLVCGGGNNDAAMLWHMAQSASKSGKDVNILLMLSDGQPSDCSWLSLKNLVVQLEQNPGMVPWNFALDVIEIPAFEQFFTDLVGQSMEEAILTMGETLAAIARERL